MSWERERIAVAILFECTAKQKQTMDGGDDLRARLPQLCKSLDEGDKELESGMVGGDLLTLMIVVRSSGVQGLEFGWI